MYVRPLSALSCLAGSALVALVATAAINPALDLSAVPAREPGLPPPTVVEQPSTRSAAWDGESWVLHEWGTFTSLQGSDGAVLDGLRHEETDLPEFVHDLRDVTGVTGVSPKMETPVIYFYAPEQRRVRVWVDFPRGVITQWYPGASQVNHVPLPAHLGGPGPAPSPEPVHDLRQGYVGWGQQNDLLVLGPDARPALPPVDEDDPWRFCREVDANDLQVCNLTLGLQEPTSQVAYERERCLFYRGLGDFQLPLRGRVIEEAAREDGTAVRVSLSLENVGADGPLTHVFLVYVEGGRAGFQVLGDLPGRRDLDGLELDLAPLAESTEALVEALTEHLTAAGLYEREARAMARTWQQGYFQDEGLRALYVLPEAFVERELPLRTEGFGRLSRGLDDQPVHVVDDRVRVFVGRTELLSPRREARILAAVEGIAQGQDEASAVLERWGRFAIPYLERARQLTADPAAQAHVDRCLDDLTVRR
jgi:hypothetical protein